MKKLLLILFLVCGLFLVCSPLFAQEAKATSLMSKPVPGNRDKELLMLLVEYPPGPSAPVHRHNAQALVYVLEGSVIIGLNGEKPVTCVPSMFDSWRGESPRANLMEVKDSDAQG